MSKDGRQKAPVVSTDTLTVAPPPSSPYVRIVPLGGCGEIGRNMTVIETNEDLVVVDCGLMFPDEEMYGVDIVINDFTYVRERAQKLRALLVTHGHEDHIGALAHLQLGRAFALSGDKTKALTAYRDFLTLWKDADPDIPILQQAKAEYGRLQ